MLVFVAYVTDRVLQLSHAFNQNLYLSRLDFDQVFEISYIAFHLGHIVFHLLPQMQMVLFSLGHYIMVGQNCGKPDYLFFGSHANDKLDAALWTNRQVVKVGLYLTEQIFGGLNAYLQVLGLYLRLCQSQAVRF